MQPEDGQVDENWKKDQAESPGKEVTGQISHGDPEVTQKVPEILDSHENDQSDNKETNPFDTKRTGQEHP